MSTATMLDIALSESREERSLEDLLREVWRRVLKCDRVSDTDEFAALGGSSVLAGELCVEIEQMFGARLPLSVVFRARTVREMAAGLREARWAPIANLETSSARTPKDAASSR